MTVKVDLLPVERKKPKLIDAFTIILLILFIAAAVGMWAYGKVVLDHKIAGLKKEQAEIKREIENLAPVKQEIERLRQTAQNIRQQIQLLRDLKRNPSDFSRLIEEIKKILPKNVWLSSLNFDSGAKTVKFDATVLGTSSMQPLETIGILMRNLRSNPAFANPVVGGAVREDRGGYITYKFSLTANYNLEAFRPAEGGESK